MIRRTLALAALALLSCSPNPPRSIPPEVREAMDLLAAQTLATGKFKGLVIGVLREGTSAVYGYGRISAATEQPPDGRTLFEIGSITKTFTGLLLALAAEEGQVALDDPVRTLLPGAVQVPSSGGKEITLAQLAAHTSGLPRLPSNLVSKNPLNPYADYTVPELYAFLASHRLRRDPGGPYEYSNLGAGLLGHALELLARTTYEELVVSRIGAPLGLADTRIAPGVDQRPRVAPGHWPGGQETPGWDIPVIAGAGALRSTADDLLKYLAAQLSPGDAPLGRAMRAAHAARAPVDDDNHVGLGWHRGRLPKSRLTMIWHDGGTGGYRSFAGFVPEARTAAVVLSNSSEEMGLLPLLVLEFLCR